MSRIISALCITLVLHELGHIVCIMIFNVFTRRHIYDFKLSFSVKSVKVVHEKYSQRCFNLIVALGGSVFPLVVSLILYCFYLNNELINLLCVCSIVNLVNITPIFPDGKNIQLLIGGTSK